MIATALIVLQLTAPAPPDASFAGCSDGERRALAIALAAMAAGDTVPPGEVPGRGNEGTAAGCDAIRLAKLSLLGWIEARSLASKGGAVELLGPTTRRLAELETLKSGTMPIEVEFSQVAIRAAVAAAQDERPEMELLLQQARDLGERLAQRGRRAVWPRPFNLLAGELWFEVDRYEEARAAFERAAAYDDSAAAFVGLGRALAALDRHAEACAAYRRVHDAAPALLEETLAFVAGCR